MAYVKTAWRNRAEPAIDADNLNKIEEGIHEVESNLAIHVVSPTAHEDIRNKLNTIDSAVSQLQSEKMEFYEVAYENGHIVKDGVVQTYAMLKEKFDNPKYWLYLHNVGVNYLPLGVSDSTSYLQFNAQYDVTSGLRYESISIDGNNVVTTNRRTFEVTEDKVASVNSRNKDSEKFYPSVKAMTSYAPSKDELNTVSNELSGLTESVDELKDDLSQVSESITEISNSVFDNYKYKWVYGKFIAATGEYSDTSNPRCADITYLPVANGTRISIKDGWMYNHAVYGSDSFSSFEGYVTFKSEDTLFTENKFVRVSLRKSDNTSFTVAEAENVLTISNLKKDKVHELSDEIDNVSAKIESVLSNRNIMNLGSAFKDGYLYSGQSGEGQNANFTYKKDIPVKGGTTYKSNYPMRFIVAYDANGSQYAYTTSEQYEYTPTKDGYLTITVRMGYKLLIKVYDSQHGESDVELIGQKFSEESLAFPSVYKHPKLFGKVVYNFGDSISKGEGNDNYGYAEMLRDGTGCKLYEYGVGGATIATGSGTTNTIEVQINQAIAHITQYNNSLADIVLLNGSTNDFGYAYPIGSANDNYDGTYDKTTICGGMENCIYKIKQAFPNSIIVFVLVHKNRRITTTDNQGHTMTYEQIVKAQKEVCHKWGIPYVDIYNKGMNTRYAYNSETYSIDGTHPNELGYRKFYYPQVLSELESVL